MSLSFFFCRQKPVLIKKILHNYRVLATEHIAGEQSRIAKPNIVTGIYMLRLTNSNSVKVQKIVINR